MEMLEAILFYFHIEMKYSEILAALASRHGMVISLSHLKRVLKANNLRRRTFADPGTIIDFVITQLDGPSRLHGYRWMHAKCLEHGIRARKEDVRIILELLDPEGVALRRRRRLQRRQYFFKRTKLHLARRFLRQTKALWNLHQRVH